MSEKSVHDIAHDAEEWTVSCRDCGAERGWDCNHPYWQDNDGPHRSRTIDAVLAAVTPIIRAEALREAAALADVGHGAGCEANPDGDCLGCFRDDLLRLAGSTGRIEEER